MIGVIRRGAAVSVLGIAAPICLLAVAWLADRMFHHRSCPESRPDQHAIVEPVEQDQARERSLDELLKRYGQVCKGPEAIDDCTPFAFDYMLAPKFRELGVTRSDLERRWLAELSSGDPVAPFGLGWLGSKRALPALRDLLLVARSCALSTATRPDDTDTLFSDDQFPRQRALIAVIERISGRPVRDTVGKLSWFERVQLYRDTEGCEGSRAATWLLHKFDGAPLPSSSQNRAKRLACPFARDGFNF